MSDIAARLTGAFIYPVKSLRGIATDTITIANGAPVGDRLWMLVDDRGAFMHARDYPHMATLSVARRDDGIAIGAGTSELILRRQAIEPDADVQHIRLWRRAAPVIAVGREADAWFSDALSMSCRLFQIAEGHASLDTPPYEMDATLQDATPFHIISTDSVSDLSSRAGETIPVIRFRPNLVVSGAEPYAEDRWRRMSIAGHRFDWVKACTRCVLTTTDHLTGERPSKEPLRTLARYRRLGNTVVLGHYFTCQSRSGVLAVGDMVQGQ